VAAAFGFPATESTVRTLSKVTRFASDVETLKRLRALLHNTDTAQVLRGLPRVTRAVVEILSDPWLRGVSGSRLVREAAGRDDDRAQCDYPGHLLWELNALRTEADRTGRRDRVGRIDSIEALHEIVESLREHPDVGYPAPPAPLAGLPGIIEPLTTVDALAEEGRAMRHCVRTRAGAMLQGQSLLFRVLADSRHDTSRATLELRPGVDGQWHVAQLLGARNRPVPNATFRQVESWRMSHLSATAMLPRNGTTPQIAPRMGNG
jgi:hypothetical protein